MEVGGIEPEWEMFRASIGEAVVEICGLKVLGASRGSNPSNTVVDTGGQGSGPTEERGLQGYVVPEVSGGSCKVPTGPMCCDFCCERGKARSVCKKFREDMEKDFRPSGEESGEPSSAVQQRCLL